MMTEKVENYLREKYPQCFNDDYRPLCIGIDKIIFKEEHPFSRRELRRGIGYYVHHEQYITNMRVGRPRIDLQAKATTTVVQSEIDGLQKLKQKADQAGGFDVLAQKQARKKKKRYRLKKTIVNKEIRAEQDVINKQKDGEQRLAQAKQREEVERNTVKKWKPSTKKTIKPVVIKKATRPKRKTESVAKIKERLKQEKPSLLLKNGVKVTVLRKR